MSEVRDGYMEFRERLLDELKRINGAVEKLAEKQDETSDEITSMKETLSELRVKSGVWGAVAGMIPASAAFIWSIVKR